MRFWNNEWPIRYQVAYWLHRWVNVYAWNHTGNNVVWWINNWLADRWIHWYVGRQLERDERRRLWR